MRDLSYMIFDRLLEEIVRRLVEWVVRKIYCLWTILKSTSQQLKQLHRLRNDNIGYRWGLIESNRVSETLKTQGS